MKKIMARFFFVNCIISSFFYRFFMYVLTFLSVRLSFFLLYWYCTIPIITGKNIILDFHSIFFLNQDLFTIFLNFALFSYLFIFFSYVWSYLITFYHPWSWSPFSLFFSSFHTSIFFVFFFFHFFTIYFFRTYIMSKIMKCH